MAAAAVLSFQSPSHFVHSFPFNRQVLKLRNPVLSLTEIADKSTPFTSQKPSISNTKGSCGSTYALGRKKDGTEESTNGIKAPNTSSREEIVSLFRRIQSSISKAETQRARTESSDSSNDKSMTESVMDVLHKSGKNLQDTRPKKGAKALRWRSGVPKKRQGEGKKAPAASEEFNLSRPPSNFMKRSPIPHLTAIRMMTDEGSELANIEKQKAPAAMEGFNLSRVPSNFMKKSPILHPTVPRTRTPEGNIEAVYTVEGSTLANIEKLRLSELKELAKARGIKGYSKLRKSELLQLLIP
ncbi:hypothetical protein like AT4G18740 [Hibiscus trionum]|uniref:Rho termination factor-like N-terminal domain-containing protein n=1 Tax=Hibiscus trionum TaxID=183268 RepID=A0A9W7JJR9_HIBTR|nr:hypothetical protein like AT4G18740 [Hibiscus trionum]